MKCIQCGKDVDLICLCQKCHACKTCKANKKELEVWHGEAIRLRKKLKDYSYYVAEESIK